MLLKLFPGYYLVENWETVANIPAYLIWDPGVSINILGMPNERFLVIIPKRYYKVYMSLVISYIYI